MFVAVNVNADGRQNVMCVDREPVQMQHRDVDLVKTLARQCGEALGNADLASHLRQHPHVLSRQYARHQKVPHPIGQPFNGVEPLIEGTAIFWLASPLLRSRWSLERQFRLLSNLRLLCVPCQLI